MIKDEQIERREYLFLAVIFLTALLVRLYFIPFFRVISADGIGYVSAARSLLKGIYSPMTTYGVVYPSLTAAVSLTGISTELAGRLVSAFMGSLLVVPLYLLARDFFDRKVGAIACILVVAWPPLRSWAGEVMTQATYITLLVTWFWLLWRAYRRGSIPLSFAAGAVAGLSYLTRPESLVAFAVMSFVLLLPYAGTWTVKKRIILMITCVGAFVLMLVPFILLVHHVTGQWQLTGKGGVTLADALSEYLGRPDMKNEPAFKGIGFLDVIRSYPEFLWINFVNNFERTLQILFPWYLYVAVLIGLVVGGWKLERVMERLFLLASFAPLGIIMVFFFVGPEYLQPYLPVLFLWAGNGMCKAEQWLLLAFPKEKFLKYVALSPLAITVALLLTLFSFIGQIPADRNKPYHYADDGGRYDHRRIGELLKKHLPAGSKIMTRSGRISFYAEMENVGMPQADLQEMIDHARKKGARYIIVDGMLTQMRPQFGTFFAPLQNSPENILYIPAPDDAQFSPIPGVRFHLLYKDPSSLGVAVYEITP